MNFRYYPEYKHSNSNNLHSLFGSQIDSLDSECMDCLAQWHLRFEVTKALTVLAPKCFIFTMKSMNVNQLNDFSVEYNKISN